MTRFTGERQQGGNNEREGEGESGREREKEWESLWRLLLSASTRRKAWKCRADNFSGPVAHLTPASPALFLPSLHLYSIPPALTSLNPFTKTPHTGLASRLFTVNRSAVDDCWLCFTKPPSVWKRVAGKGKAELNSLMGGKAQNERQPELCYFRFPAAAVKTPQANLTTCERHFRAICYNNYCNS